MGEKYDEFNKTSKMICHLFEQHNEAAGWSNFLAIQRGQTHICKFCDNFCFHFRALGDNLDSFALLPNVDTTQVGDLVLNHLQSLPLALYTKLHLIVFIN